MPTQAADRTASVTTLQGQIVPPNAINPKVFFAKTRRKRYTEYTRNFAGLGGVDTVELRKSDILSALYVRFSGTLAVVHGTGTAATTARWPYDVVNRFKFTANGASNLWNASGLKVKVRDVIVNPVAEDRGVSQSVNGATVNQGTLSQASESWGVGSQATAIASGNYAVELMWRIAVAEDERDLSGAIFAQTSSTDLTLSIEWNTAAALFVITGNDTMTLTGSVIVEAEKFSIPSDSGLMIIPDLSLFHSVVQTSPSGGNIGTGDNEPRLIGQGAGRAMLRVFYQVWSGSAGLQTPLAATAANYGGQGWRYGTNETPEYFPDGRSLRQYNERTFGSDIGSVWGFLAHDFATTWGFRDIVDQGATSDLRLFINIQAALSNQILEYVQEVMFAAGSAA